MLFLPPERVTAEWSSRETLLKANNFFFASRQRGENGKVEPLLADQIELLENADGVITNIVDLYMQWCNVGNRICHWWSWQIVSRLYTYLAWAAAASLLSSYYLAQHNFFWQFMHSIQQRWDWLKGLTHQLSRARTQCWTWGAKKGYYYHCSSRTCFWSCQTTAVMVSLTRSNSSHSINVKLHAYITITTA